MGVDGGDAAVGWSGTGSAALGVEGGEAAVRQSDRCESSHGFRNDRLGSSVEATFAKHDFQNETPDVAPLYSEDLDIWDFYDADGYAEVGHKALPEIADGETFLFDVCP